MSLTDLSHLDAPVYGVAPAAQEAGDDAECLGLAEAPGPGPQHCGDIPDDRPYKSDVVPDVRVSFLPEAIAREIWPNL